MMKIRVFASLMLIAIVLSSLVPTYFVAYQANWMIGDYRPYPYVYYPWAFWMWCLEQGLSDYKVLQYGVMIAMATFGGSFLLPWFVWTKIFANPTRMDDLHGTAKWANNKDINNLGYNKINKGVQLGGWSGPDQNQKTEYLVHNGPEHIMLLAPTRSGKGIGVIIPTMHRWEGSMVVLDIKGENYAMSAGSRKKDGSLVMCLDPTDSSGNAARYNPLKEIDWGGVDETRDIQNVAEILSARPGAKDDNDYFAMAGKSFLTGCIAYHMYLCAEKNITPSLAGVDNLMNQLNGNQEEGFAKMAQCEHPLASMTGNDMIGKGDKERGSVISSALISFQLFRDPIVAENTKSSSFTINDLVNNDRPVSLYIVVRPSDMKRLQPIVRVLITQIVSKLTTEMDYSSGTGQSGNKHRLLLLLDEFPALGRMDLVEKALGYMASYGVKALIIAQDISQLNKEYSKENSLMANCHIRMAYAPNTIESAEMISKMLGETTVVKKDISTSSDPGAIWSERVNESFRETKRSLMTPDEVMSLRGLEKDAKGDVTKAGEVLIMVAGQPPIRGVQTPWFMDPWFKRRVDVRAPLRSDSLYSLPKLILPGKKKPDTSPTSSEAIDSKEKSLAESWQQKANAESDKQKANAESDKQKSDDKPDDDTDWMQKAMQADLDIAESDDDGEDDTDWMQKAMQDDFDADGDNDEEVQS